jgi:3-hydroxyacyl-CoA dehydrogenase/enoyl-CoA hydratase/3-hydroxybutyryl-CoA epimerase
MTDFTMQVDADGVAVLAWDVPGKSMNVLTLDSLRDLDRLVDQALAEPGVRGIVVTSGKKDFAGGMDLNVIARMKEDAGDEPARGLFDGIMGMHRVLRKLERAGMDAKTGKGGKPVACALPGTALGIGYEIALACHRILAADNPARRSACPRSRSASSLARAAPRAWSARWAPWPPRPSSSKASSRTPRRPSPPGIVDEVVPPEELMDRARAWVLSAAGTDLRKPWDRKDYRMPGGTPYHPAGYMTYVGASAMVNAKTFGVYPAAKALLSAVYEGALVNFDNALKVEARWFVNILMNPSSSAMIRSLFINMQALQKGANRPQAPDQKVRRLGRPRRRHDGRGHRPCRGERGHRGGAGGLHAGGGRARARAQREVLDKDLSRRRISEEKKSEVLARITPTTDHAALSDCDLIVEAVFEDPAVKAEVTRKVLEHVPADCIFATNTSTLPITELAKASDRPDQFIGIHFFSPVDKMQLVEIIRGRETGDRAVAKALDFARQIGKTPIVVADARFFYANRCIIPYLNEGVRMLAEGVKPALIENAARMAGMPLGPAAAHRRDLHRPRRQDRQGHPRRLGRRLQDEAVDRVLFPWPRKGAWAARPRPASTPTTKRASVRASGPTLASASPRRRAAGPPGGAGAPPLHASLEAVRALEEGVLTDIREGDVGAILAGASRPGRAGPSLARHAGRPLRSRPRPGTGRPPRPPLRPTRPPARDGRARRDLPRPLRPHPSQGRVT